MVATVPVVTNWSVTPQNGQVGYFTLMNTWLFESTSVIASLNNAIIKINEAGQDINDIGANAINAITFDNIVQLKLNSDIGRVDVLGYYTKGDGGDGTFYWDSTSTESDNGGTIIQATGITTGRWKRVYSGAVNIKWFGAKGDGISDDTVAIQTALNFTSIKKQILFMGASKYVVTDTINIPEGGQILGESLYQYGKGFGIDPKATSIIFNPTSLKSLFVFNGTLHGGFRIHNSIQNLYLEGNSTNSLGNSNYAIEVNKVIYGLFKNISIDKSFRTAIKCDGTINNRFENVYTTGFVQCIEYIGNNETTDVWEQCSLWSSLKGAVLNGSTAGIRFNNCLIEQIDDYGFDLSAATGNLIVSNLYCEDVPFASNVADNSVFRVGAFGTSNKSSIQLTVSNSNIRGKNASTIGNAFYVADTDGIVINNTFIRKFSTGINTTNATRGTSVLVNNVVHTACTAVSSGSSKIVGSSTLQLSDASLVYLTRATFGYFNEIKPYNASDLTLSNTTTSMVCSATNFYPSTDNAMTLGLSNRRFSTIYAGTGTINTSDDREKTYLDITDTEKKVAIELKANMKKFKFNNSIEEKGEDKARIHFGASAQTVKSIFEKYELNAFDYSILCCDEWEEQEEIKNESGDIIQEHRPSGNRYGLRYEELLSFIIGCI